MQGGDSFWSGPSCVALEVFREDAVARKGHCEPIGLVLHVGPGQGAQVLDQLLAASVQLLVVDVDLGLAEGVAAPPFTLGAAELDVPSTVNLLVPIDPPKEGPSATGGGGD